MAKIDKNLVQQRFARSLKTYANEAAIQREMAETLLDQLHLALCERQFEQIAEAGCGTGVLTDLLETRFDFARLYLIDLVPECAQFHRHRRGAQFLTGDLETMELPPELDLIVSNAVFQWIDDLPPFFTRLSAALKPGGILAFTTFGPENLREIAALTGTGLQYRSSGEWCALLENEYEVLGCQEALHILEFPEPLAVLRHLKSTGVTGTGSTAPWSRRKLTEFSRRYHDEFSQENDRIPLTYHPITLIARKRQK